MGKGKKSASAKKAAAAKVTFAQRADITRLVDKLIKKCAKVSGQTSFSVKQEVEDFTEIFSIVEQIRVLEAEVVLPKYDRSEQLKKLLPWAKEKKIKMNKVSISAYGSSGHGLVCQEEIMPGEPVIEVPATAMMTEHTATASYLGPLIERDPLLQDMGNVRLALHVLVEYLNPSSPWHPYVASLPSEFDTPLHFTPDHINAMKHSPVLESVVRQYRNIARQYAYFYRILHRVPEARDWPLTEYFTYDAYRWSVCCVSTRINSVPLTAAERKKTGRNTQLALVPCWDLVNHASAQMSTDFLPLERTLVCYANASFTAGQQFTMHYGDRGNADLFLHSAFVDKGNPHDSVLLRLGLSKSDPLLDVKTRALSALAMQGAKEFPIVAGRTPLSPQLWAFTVVFSSDQEFLTEVIESKDPATLVLSVASDPSHSGLRLKAYNFLHARLGLLLRLYQAAPASTDGPLYSLISDLLREECCLLTAAHLYLSRAIVQQGAE